MPTRKRKGQSIRAPNPKRPFAGDTPWHVRQTIDIGAGDFSHWVYEIGGSEKIIPYLARQATKYPRRKYVAIDPRLSTEKWSLLSNLSLERGFSEDVIPELIKSGIKTRHINLGMPFPIDRTSTYVSSGPHRMEVIFRDYFSGILQAAPHLLLPNGKIFVNTEKKTFVDIMKQLAREYGFSFREKRVMPWIQKITHSRSTRGYEIEPIYRVELTFGLRRALPDKNARKKWPLH